MEGGTGEASVGYEAPDIEFAGFETAEDWDDNDFFNDLAKNSEKSYSEEIASGVLAETAEEDNSTKKSVEQEKAEIREQTIAQLEAHYGDEIIYYGTYQGPIAYIADACPAFQFVLTQGFDKSVSWIEANRIAKPEEKPEEEPKQENIEEDTSKEEANTTTEDKKPEVKEVKVEKLTEKTEEKKAEPSVFEKSVAVPIVEKAVEKGVDSPVEIIAETTAASDLEVAQAQVTETTPVIEVTQEVATITEIVPDAQSNGESTEKDIDSVQPVEEKVEVPVPPEVLQVEESVEEMIVKADTTNKAEAEVKTELEIEPESTNDYEEEEYPLLATLAVPIVATKVFADAIEDDEDDEQVAEDTLVEAKVEDDEPQPTPLAEHFSNWHELAKEQTPLEELFVTIVEQLDNEDFDEIFESEANQENEDNETRAEKETILDTVLASGVEDEDVAETITESSTEVEELEQDSVSEMFEQITDEELEKEAPAELYGIVLAVKSARQTVEKLYTAKTKQECATYVEQLAVELAEVLRGLGYKNPEEIIQAFLANHSPQALYSLVVELENALRRTAQQRVRTVREQKLKHSKHRTTRLGKVTTFIMRALLGHFKPTPSSEPVY